MPEALPSHVDQMNEGQFPSVYPAGKGTGAIFSALDVVEGFQGRGSGSKNANRPIQHGTVYGDVPPVIARGVFLLVGRFVLLVHDHQSKVRDRGEDGRSGPDHDPCFPPGDGTPGIKPFPCREMTVPNHDLLGLFAEAVAETGNGLRSEGYLGNEEEDASPERQGLLHGLEVDFRLAGPGNAMEKAGFE